MVRGERGGGGGEAGRQVSHLHDELSLIVEAEERLEEAPAAELVDGLEGAEPLLQHLLVLVAPGLRRLRQLVPHRRAGGRAPRELDSLSALAIRRDGAPNFKYCAAPQTQGPSRPLTLAGVLGGYTSS